MTYSVNDGPTPTASFLSQALFVLAGLAIIAGGIWTLYMSNAPYHPEVGMTGGEVFLASE